MKVSTLSVVLLSASTMTAALPVATDPVISPCLPDITTGIPKEPPFFRVGEVQKRQEVPSMDFMNPGEPFMNRFLNNISSLFERMTSFFGGAGP
ncbi:hypothetical protein H072_4964 [Dactylellina haptotyla CBS 200.50]|uniref:Uncharacterized protein n=1 Tax=Dactylellina haptotyla (strain CBS 200.50) TaxID=1284197 RepID=S8ADP1_DACHA|nr:hypothetical protein H072_4964 [Dactylellina haptotyla CBS 200.50]